MSSQRRSFDAYVADTTPPQDRGRYYGILGAASGFGFIIGPAIGGLAGQFSLSMPLYVAAAVTLGNVLWAYFALPESLPPEKRAHDFEWGQLNPFAPFASIFNSATLRIAFGASFLFFLGGTMLQSNFSVFLKEIMSFGPAGIGAILLIVVVMDIVNQGQQAIARIVGPLLAAFLYTLSASGPYFAGAAAIFVALAILFAYPT